MIWGQILSLPWNIRLLWTQGLLYKLDRKDVKDWVQALEQPMASRIIFWTITWRRGKEGPSCSKLKCCKNLIFSQYRVVVFVVKHLSFCQYGRVRSLWPKFLSPAFLNLWIHFRSLNVVLSPRFPTSESKSQNSISTNTPRTPLIFGQPSYMFFSHIVYM